MKSTATAALSTAASKGELFNSAVLTGLHHAIVKTHEAHTVCTSVHKPPEEFDARIQLSDYMTPIQDQGTCGSCWAFASTAVLADRYAWFMNQSNVVLAAEYLLYCGETAPNTSTDATLEGCHGGTVAQAFNFLQVNGTLSLGCSHYTYAQWSEKDARAKYHCRQLDACPSSSQYKPYMYHALGAYIVPGTIQQHSLGSEENIRADMFYNGTSCSTFTVYQDFLQYWSDLVSGLLPASSDKSVYKWDKRSANIGAHAIRIMGWGVHHGAGSAPMPYWIVANSWGATNWDTSDYGPNGVFRMLRGVDECGIESNVISAVPMTQPAAMSPFGHHASINGGIEIDGLCSAHVIPLTPELYESLGYAPLKPLSIKGIMTLPPPSGKRPSFPYLQQCPRSTPKRCIGSAICLPEWWPCAEVLREDGSAHHGKARIAEEFPVVVMPPVNNNTTPLIIGLSCLSACLVLIIIILCCTYCKFYTRVVI
jgi:cathepsin B